MVEDQPELPGVGTLDDQILAFQQKAEKQIPAGADRDAVFDEAAWWDARVDRLKTKNDARRADTELRAKYAEKAFELATCAVWFWIVMFIATAITNTTMGKPALSDNALITLTSGATINVIAVCLVVVRGLFPAKLRKKENSGL